MKLKAILIAAASVLGMSAQTASVDMEAKVPFAFEVNGRTMPAGEYSLHSEAPKTYATVKHAATGRGFLFEVRKTSGVRMERSVLVFDRRGDRFVLRAVADKQTGAAIDIPQSRGAGEAAVSAVSRIALTVAE